MGGSFCLLTFGHRYKPPLPYFVGSKRKKERKKGYIFTTQVLCYGISSRFAFPGELFSSEFRACARSPRWETRCSFGLLKVSCSCYAATRSPVRKLALPVASSPLSEQRRTRLLFAQQIEVFQVKAWLATFTARNANVKLLDDRCNRSQIFVFHKAKKKIRTSNNLYKITTVSYMCTWTKTCVQLLEQYSAFTVT